jgi:hypothetical protein
VRLYEGLWVTYRGAGGVSLVAWSDIWGVSFAYVMLFLPYETVPRLRFRGNFTWMVSRSDDESRLCVVSHLSYHFWSVFTDNEVMVSMLKGQDVLDSSTNVIVTL